MCIDVFDTGYDTSFTVCFYLLLFLVYVPKMQLNTNLHPRCEDL